MPIWQEMMELPSHKAQGYDMYAVLPPNDFSHLPIVDPPCATQALVCGQKFPPLENGRQKQQKHSPFPPSEADKRNKIARPYQKRKAQQHSTCSIIQVLTIPGVSGEDVNA